MAEKIIAHTKGIHCEAADFGLTACIGGSGPLFGKTHLRAGTTIGDYYFTDPDTDPRYVSNVDPSKLWHESVHSWQTAAAAQLGLSPAAYFAVYLAVGATGSANEFEQQANLCKGGYGC